MGLCSPKLHRELLNELLNASFSGYLETIMQLLGKMGYEDIQVGSRGDFVGRHKDGGVDLKCYRPVPGGRRLIIVQIKQFIPERLVYRRTLDELRGVVIRDGAAEGLLITTSGYALAVDRVEYSSAATAPLRLIDGIELTGMMALHTVGVRVVAPTEFMSEGRYRVDHEFFGKHRKDIKSEVRCMQRDPIFSYQVIRTTSRKRRWR